MAKYTQSDSLTCLPSLASIFQKEWSIWVHVLRVDLLSKWYVWWNELNIMIYEALFCAVGLRILAADGYCELDHHDSAITPWYFICKSTEDNSRQSHWLSHASSLCDVWCVMICPWRGRIKLAMMSAWKHLSVWLIPNRGQISRHLVSCPHRASISYLIQIMEDILLHSNKVTSHRESSRLVGCALSVLCGLQVWADASVLLCLCAKTPSLVTLQAP